MSPRKFERERVSGTPVSDGELLDDLKCVARYLGTDTIQQMRYRELGKYDDSTVTRRFGTWNNALRRAGLRVSNELNITDVDLFENLLVLWMHYGKQPRRSYLASPPSKYSQSPYNRTFGSWNAALDQFVKYANTRETPEFRFKTKQSPNLKTPRDPSLRLRWKVMDRDRFSCVKCGASKAKSVYVELHVDHVVPWSKGGETIIGNLQTLCSKCNLGKSNL